MRPRHHLHPTTALISAVVLLLLLAVTASTRPAAPAQDPASAYLATHPGGTKLNSNEVGYGPLVVTVTQPRATAVADCPAGWFCFYAGINYTYPRGKLSACGHQNLADYGWTNRIDSVYYDMQNGKVTFYNDGAVDTALFTVSTSTRGDTDVSPNRDKADYVYRTC